MVCTIDMKVGVNCICPDTQHMVCTIDMKVGVNCIRPDTQHIYGVY